MRAEHAPSTADLRGAASPAAAEPATGTDPTAGGALARSLLLTLALLSAFTPFATDLYLPAFPAMVGDLGTTTTGVQLSLTAFFVGAGAGQLAFGPLSDRYGRRGPLLIGATIALLASLGTVLAPTVGLLVAARALQGAAGAAGMVISRAVASDLTTGRAAARAFSLIMVVGGVAPVVAPVAGSLLVAPLGWRGLLGVVAAISALSLAAVIAFVPESNPTHRRAVHVPGARRPATRIGSPAFLGNAATFVFGFAAMMAYIAASPFLYQVMMGLSPTWYGLLFGINALALMAVSTASARLVHRVAPGRLLLTGLLVMTAAALVFLALTLAHAPARWLALPVFVVVAGLGLVLGNATALSLGALPPHAIGTGSAVLGASQFAVAAAVSALVGVGGEHTALPLAATMATALVLALAGWALARRAPAHPDA